MTDNTTPLQEAIHRIENGDPKYCTPAEVVSILESLLPKEKDFINKVWGAAIKRTWAEYRSETSSDTPDNQQFIDKYYSK